ncbi:MULTISPECIES: 5-(carboxyamino)imidazole ribonucleotide synthase [unclassified Aureimonas]|uniref:5-(carboxyamino)imidazole ribonucleotide synthase n=1 Tax=unclassified Aureimonas TaxID=2615206 RepID=UPI0006FC51BB|nr:MULTISPECIES: 5-(carboxyamino)imidazole ribonucleotide synthase [unclassified Aureimonas]KQT52141.1 phosphoribosylaminoimidazole carboxylase [Aureimonas sp. Leaf427]KQT70625.1 phosphoribosylaminoimidazole carboxylase [Aureimonas sp. Leaf460]
MSAPLPIGATIGIVGGGQLARMLASAAARLGYRTLILDPDAACPAAQLANETIVARYDDVTALADLAERSAVVTYEFENVPVDPIRTVEAKTPVFPPPNALEVSQDRVVEKAFLNGIGIATAGWRAVDTAQELDHALNDLGGDCILKTRRFGYDGKGQATIRPKSPYADAFESLGGKPSILEKKVPFLYELSVIAARGRTGEIRVYDAAENVHSLGILKRSTAPGRIPLYVAAEAAAIATEILERLDYVGVIGVEFFAAESGLLVNEIAPRVHNSGHWTEAACTVSQFEQHIRAVAGLPLGETQRHSDCVMENLIGADVEKALPLLSEPNLVLTLYGKSEARPGRKMGHFTRLKPLGLG